MNGWMVQALEESAVPKAMAKAESVMRNVKAKGAAAGDVMDAQTEEMLWPQVVNEALARGIVEMVQQLHRASHLWAASHPDNAAKWEGEGSEGADWEQLDEALLDSLGLPSPPPSDQSSNKHDASGGGVRGPGFGYMDGFMDGDEWPKLVLQDVQRMLRSADQGKKRTAAAATKEASRQLDAPPPSSSSSGGYEMTPMPVPERVEEGSNGDILWLDMNSGSIGFGFSSRNTTA